MFERHLVKLEICQIVLLLQLLGVLNARGADIDADHPGLGAAHRVLGGLPRATSSDEDIQRRAIRLVGP